jgi:hypothetical protein
MVREKGLTKYIWIIVVVLALFIMGFCLMCVTWPIDLVDYGLEMSGSLMNVESLDKGAVGTFSFITRSMCMGGIWLGIIGLFCAWGLKKKENFAWNLGILWGILVLADGVFRAVSELFIMRWSTPTVCVYPYVIGSLIVIGCLLVVKEEFS